MPKAALGIPEYPEKSDSQENQIQLKEERSNKNPKPTGHLSIRSHEPKAKKSFSKSRSKNNFFKRDQNPMNQKRKGRKDWKNGGVGQKLRRSVPAS
jgi:hypothetical protein